MFVWEQRTVRRHRASGLGLQAERTIVTLSFDYVVPVLMALFAVYLVNRLGGITP